MKDNPICKAIREASSNTVKEFAKELRSWIEESWQSDVQELDDLAEAMESVSSVSEGEI